MKAESLNTSRARLFALQFSITYRLVSSHHILRMSITAGIIHRLEVEHNIGTI